jgi:hypothetical protein
LTKVIFYLVEELRVLVFDVAKKVALVYEAAGATLGATRELLAFFPTLKHKNLDQIAIKVKEMQAEEPWAEKFAVPRLRRNASGARGISGRRVA